LALALPASAGGPAVTTVPVAAAAQPTSLAQPPADPNRLFFTERAGRIRLIKSGVLQPEPFLDLTGIVSSDTSEEALSCMAFHPSYFANGYFYVTFTDVNSDSHVVRFKVSADPDVADPFSMVTILTVPQPDPSHNVGWIGFGPDGYLYIASGDGGGTTVGQFAQSLDSLLGKILRIDVDGGSPYAIPPGNPFVDLPGRDEIWAVGFRNPWRCSFDRATGDLWIADVGDGLREEINLQPAGSPGGLNYGWSCMEGTACHPAPTGCACNQPGLTAPAYNYEHFTGCAVIGGSVYRGAAIPGLQGRYVFADFCAGKVWTYDAGSGAVAVLLFSLPFIYSMGEDVSGDLYVLTADAVHKIVFIDCNGNGTPDDQDIARGTSADCNANAVPDECEPDCNGNGAPDACDLQDGTSADRNGNLVPDECDLHADLDGDADVDAGDFLLLLQAWGPCPAPPDPCAADFDGDGVVGGSDLLTLLVSWG
jgi:glucose/arabinose dehydrogenase